jgi:hypothetical protein
MDGCWAAAQYSVLGVNEFVAQYATGLIARRDYYAIPLELVAYACQARFMDNRAQAFSVRDLVQKTVGLRHADRHPSRVRARAHPHCVTTKIVVGK